MRLSSTEPVITPVDRSALAPEVAVALDAAQQRGAMSSTVLPRIWAHRPDLAVAQIQLHTRFYDSSILPARLLELIRLRIALVNECGVCQRSRKSDDVTEADVSCLGADHTSFLPAEQAALDFAAAFAEDHRSVDDGLLESVRKYFDEQQLVELIMFAALMVGSGRTAYVLRAFEELN